MHLIEANWLVFLIALVAAIAIAVWLFAHGSKPRRREYRPDVLDEGVAPARRNQALIDAPPAARFDAAPHIDPPAMAGTMAGLGEIIAVAAQDEVDASQRRVIAEVEEASELPPAAKPPVSVGQPASEPASQPASEPASGPAGSPATQDAGAPDDLGRIKGVGPKLRALLPELGITRYAQIAAMSEADLDALDGRLGAFAGRPRRDSWVEQARLLESGDTAGYEARFGKV